MRDPRERSLLDFAIAASLAVVPIMLAIVLLVAVIRPADSDSPWGAGRSNRYVSARHVAALATFEQAVVPRSAVSAALPDAVATLAALPQCRREWSAERGFGGWIARWAGRMNTNAEATPAARIAAQLAQLDAALLRFSERSNARVLQPLGFDATRWFEAAGRGLDEPVPGAQAEAAPAPTRLQCADLAAALAALVRADARMLEALAWRGTTPRPALARWQPEQQMRVTPGHVMRRNPWTGIAGCIYLGRRDGAPTHFVAGARSAQQRVCARPELYAAQRAAAPPSAAASAPAIAPLALPGEPGLADPADDARWMVPPSLQAMLQPLEALRQAASPLRPAGAPVQRVLLDGAPVAVGHSIDLTIDPALQALAQKTAACYTGRHDVCRALGLRRTEDKDAPPGQRLLEGAMVRMAAVAVLDVASGRIEALAGALSRCAREEFDGPGRDPGCDARLPYPVQYRPDALLNPAVFHDAMPASTVKPILAAAFLADPEVGARWLAAERAAMEHAAPPARASLRGQVPSGKTVQPPGTAPPARDSLRGQLLRSDSARFLDRMFCFDKGFAQCRRPWDVQASAAAFGWNAGCVEGRVDCGKRDLLFGGALDGGAPAGAAGSPPPTATLATPVAYGRLLAEPLAARPATPAMHLMPPMALDPRLVRRCALGPDGRRGSDDDWEKCRGGAMVDVVAEGWGQGHARASALGIAGMMATLAAAANGQAERPVAHLVESLRGAAPPWRGEAGAALPWRAAAPQPHGLSRDAAEVILGGLAWGHRAGTARTACEQVFDAKRCRDIGWLAGKTGTPSFPSDGISLNDLAQWCRPGSTPPPEHAKACSPLRPYKWYVAAYRADASASGPWTKVIAVLTERNWLRASGIVHGAGDHGPNPSAEIALQIAGRQLGLIGEGAP